LGPDKKKGGRKNKKGNQPKKEGLIIGWHQKTESVVSPRRGEGIAGKWPQEPYVIAARKTR